jgi:TPR repeat protein
MDPLVTSLVKLMAGGQYLEARAMLREHGGLTEDSPMTLRILGGFIEIFGIGCGVYYFDNGAPTAAISMAELSAFEHHPWSMYEGPIARCIAAYWYHYENWTSQALAELKALADAGMVEAMILYTSIYVPLYSPTTYAPVLHYIIRAAEMGLMTAQVKLGLLYMKTTDEYKDTQKGLYWLNKAAKEYNRYAIKYLVEYYSSDPIEQDMKLAFKYAQENPALVGDFINKMTGM